MLVVIMRMGMGFSVVRVFVGVFAGLVGLAGVGVVVMTVVVRVLVGVSHFIVAVGVRMICHRNLLK